MTGLLMQVEACGRHKGAEIPDLRVAATSGPVADQKAKPLELRLVCCAA